MTIVIVTKTMKAGTAVSYYCNHNNQGLVHMLPKGHYISVIWVRKYLYSCSGWRTGFRICSPCIIIVNVCKWVNVYSTAQCFGWLIPDTIFFLLNFMGILEVVALLHIPFPIPFITYQQGYVSITERLLCAMKTPPQHQRHYSITKGVFLAVLLHTLSLRPGPNILFPSNNNGKQIKNMNLINLKVNDLHFHIY